MLRKSLKDFAAPGPATLLIGATALPVTAPKRLPTPWLTPIAIRRAAGPEPRRAARRRRRRGDRAGAVAPVVQWIAQHT